MATKLPQRRTHRLPPAVYACTGYEFSFTVCARQHGRPFDNTTLADDVIASLLWTRDRYRWLLFCYCLMPDHLHFLCRLSESPERRVNCGARGELPEGVLDHLSRFKSYTTHRAWRVGLHGPLWQRSSYDRVLDLDWPFEEVAQYILENPVRRGLVGDWTRWPHSRIVDPWN